MNVNKVDKMSMSAEMYIYGCPIYIRVIHTDYPCRKLTKKDTNYASFALARELFIVVNSTCIWPLFEGFHISGLMGSTDCNMG